MKKIYKFGLAIVAFLALASCNKENTLEINDSAVDKKITIKATTEQVGDPNTKLSIAESGSSFSLNWEGSETLGLASSSNKTYKTDWKVVSCDGKNANLEGSIFDVKEETKTNWILATNLFSSTETAVRADIPINQSFNDSKMGQNCLLVARADNASVDEIPAVSFKTMNAFLKFALIKGSAASGSTHTYDKMFVQSIEVEAINEEPIAGQFEIDKTATDWSDNYSGTVSGKTSSKVTLDCTINNSDGEELSSVAKNFYVAIAFGAYSSGLKVTVNVKNQGGEAGKFEKIFKSTGVTIARNTMRSLSATVNPEDTEAPATYTLIEDPTKVVAGTYYLAGKYGDKYYLWDGTLGGSGSNRDCVTKEYVYNTTTKKLTGSGAVEISLVATTGGFFVKIGDDYLSSKSASNRRLALGSTTDVWSFDVSKDEGDHARGGLKMTEATYSMTLVSANTNSNVLRTYSVATNGNFGVYLFKKN